MAAWLSVRALEYLEHAFDLTIGLNDTGGVWSVKAWSKNITDETVLLSEGVEEDDVTGALLGYSAAPRAPRSFGVTVDYRSWL